MTLLNILTFTSYLALTADVLFQIHCVYKNKSADDVSIAGLGIRYTAILIILYKFYTLGEWPLLFGQMLLAIFFTLYLSLVIVYFKRTHTNG